MNKINKIMHFNMKAKGTPDLIDINNIDGKFFVYDNNQENIIQNAVSYFSTEPKKWSLPAKNYFVRICLCHYLRSIFHKDFYDLLNNNFILPYDDRISLPYKKAPNIYDAIIEQAGTKFYIGIGYKKTIEVFSYLYEDILKPITVGYNNTGQDFFDLLSFHKKHIKEYYLSLFHGMRHMPLQSKKELNTLSKCNTYGFKANLLLNTPVENANWDSIINQAWQHIDIGAVSVLTLDVAKQIRKKYPDLSIHLSTHGSFNLSPDEFSFGYIDVLNVSEPWYPKQKDIIVAAKKNNVKIKYIVNRGCVINKWENISNILNKKIYCSTSQDTIANGSLTGCDCICHNVVKENPWMVLTNVNLYKESLLFNKDINIIKLSTRDNTNDDIKELLDYWTSYKPTTHIFEYEIKSYQEFLKWLKMRNLFCKGNCAKCGFCKDAYNKILK